MKHRIIIDDTIVFHKDFFELNTCGEVSFRLSKKLELKAHDQIEFEKAPGFHFEVIEFTTMPSSNRDKNLFRCQIAQILQPSE